mmetsp:Transcript_7731/g.47968  ORF Transcript_7731/g.47968 Transcript_7731/m.47968 type:complete len:237 (+) Transcript_7731:1787-2497(+)
MHPKEVLGFWSQVTSRSGQHRLVVRRSCSCTDGPGLFLYESRTPQHGLPCRKGSECARGGDRGRSLFVVRFRVSLSVPPSSRDLHFFGSRTRKVCASRIRFDFVPRRHTTTVRRWLVLVLRSIPGAPRPLFFPRVSFRSSNASVVRRCVGSICFSSSHRSFYLRFLSFSSHPLDRRVSPAYFFFRSFVSPWRVLSCLHGGRRLLWPATAHVWVVLVGCSIVGFRVRLAAFPSRLAC